MTLTNDEMNAMITEVDINGKTVDDVVADWMGKNEIALAGVDRKVGRSARR